MPKDRCDITYRCTQPLYTVLLANVALYRGGYVHPKVYILIDLHYKLLFIVNIVQPNNIQYLFYYHVLF